MFTSEELYVACRQKLLTGGDEIEFLGDGYYYKGRTTSGDSFTLSSYLDSFLEPLENRANPEVRLKRIQDQRTCLNITSTGSQSVSYLIARRRDIPQMFQDVFIPEGDDPFSGDEVVIFTHTQQVTVPSEDTWLQNLYAALTA